MQLTLDFYRRNYIEGLFLSSGIIRSPDYTMEQLVRVAQMLRQDHGFRGYIHLKTIPDADPNLIEQAGRFADRLSINVELPQDKSMVKLAPQKQAGTIRKAMGGLRLRLEEAEDERRRSRRAPAFAPAGQSTQMIVGADGERDTDHPAIERDALQRVQAQTGLLLGLQPHTGIEPVAAGPQAAADARTSPVPGRLALSLFMASPWMRSWRRRKTACWISISIRSSPGRFAIASASRSTSTERHARICCGFQGLASRSVDRILKIRRLTALRLDDLAKLTRSTKTIGSFVTALDWTPGATLDGAHLAKAMKRPAEQLSLF